MAICINHAKLLRSKLTHRPALPSECKKNSSYCVGGINDVTSFDHFSNRTPLPAMNQRGYKIKNLSQYLSRQDWSSSRTNKVCRAPLLDNQYSTRTLSKRKRDTKIDIQINCCKFITPKNSTSEVQDSLN